jgi:chemotaxis response regulator CheB
MPAAAAKIGGAAEVLALPDIAPRLVRMLGVLAKKGTSS